MEPHIETFLEEARELLTDIEEAALELEADPGDSELINRVFRAMHTIKGSGAMFGFDDVAGFTHHLETALDRVREGHYAVTKDLIDVVLTSRDYIAGLLSAQLEGVAPDFDEGQRIMDRLQVLIPSECEQSGNVVGAAREAKGGGSSQILRILMKLDPCVMKTGLDPIVLLAELESLGEMTVTGQAADVPSLRDLAFDECHLWWDILLHTDAGVDAVKDVFIFVEDDSVIDISVLGGEAQQPEKDMRLGEILVERGDATPEQVDMALQDQKRTGELLAEQGVDQAKIDAALAQQRAMRSRRDQAEASSIRVAAEKLDSLMNLVGELVITQAQLTQVAAQCDKPELALTVENVERLTTEIRDCVLNVRMLPIGATFNKFGRLVRDLSSELGKLAGLETSGSETEVDKTVIECLGDPLVHLIRNSVDHGIEAPDVREAAGKPRAGTISLRASQAGGDVIIVVADDGAGIDPEKVARKAVEKGIIPSAEGLTRTEVLDLILQPGFSTAEKVTDVSGRGVGMDVVRREIDKLRGTVTIESELGRGTTVTIKLPLTLAIVDGLLTGVGADRYVVQLSEVRECVELTSEQRDFEEAGRHLVSVRGELVPYVRLRDLFDLPRRDIEIEQAVIVMVGEHPLGVVVDAVIGNVQTVIKPLGRMFSQADYLSGATILGDGTVALILDLPHIMAQAHAADGRAQVA
ncbi:MAG TPA: chemotaxis protein CheA [Armatimonadetes bacterium]|nr:chemotaxis protein CheA [Armatimonadota bacterium]